MSGRGPLHLLRWLLVIAVLVSIVHYVDNTVNFRDYPQPTTGPAPSRVLVGTSWFVFTAFAVAGYVAFARGRHPRLAAACLAAYSGSGLVGMGHYMVPGATGMPWWRQAHVIACGLAVLGFAVSSAKADLDFSRRQRGSTPRL